MVSNIASESRVSWLHESLVEICGDMVSPSNPKRFKTVSFFILYHLNLCACLVAISPLACQNLSIVLILSGGPGLAIYLAICLFCSHPSVSFLFRCICLTVGLTRELFIFHFDVSI